MKRQVAIVGDTPEFLRWSVRKNCLLREGTDTHSIDQTEKRLRAIRAAGLAIGQDRVVDGIAVRKFDTQWKGFRLNEAAAFWNTADNRHGLANVKEACTGCPANILCEPTKHGSIAGCHGWLPRQIESETGPLDIGQLFQQIVDHDDSVRRAKEKNGFLNTDPVWYGLWASGELSGEPLLWLEEQFSRLASAHRLAGLTDFADVLRGCISGQMTLDVELVPAGHSDGVHWRIGVHCDQCKAPFVDQQRYCRCCQKAGQGHPMIKKRVLGLRPYIDLAILLGDQQAASEFLEKHKLH